MAAATATEAIDRLVTRAGRLYSLPAVAMEVLALTDSPQADARALKACVENDPALTGKLLRVVNSSLFGLSRQVTDLGQALALLGTKPLKLLVLGFSLPSGLFQGIEAEVLGWYWRRTLTKAVAARDVWEAVHHSSGDEAFVAGLLQDVGLLLLVQELGDPYVKFLNKVRQSGYELERAERESIGFSHTTLTSRLLEHWGLPKLLTEAAGAAAVTTAGSEDHSPLIVVVAVAERIARFLADQHTAIFPELVAASARLGLEQHQLERLLDQLEQKVSQLADVLSLRLPKPVDCTELLARAHRRLAEVAEEASGELLRQEQPSCEARRLADAFAGLARSTSGSTATGQAPSRAAPPVASRHASPSLEKALAKCVAACRHSRWPLSVLAIQLERQDDPCSADRSLFQQAMGRLEAACAALDHPGLVRHPEGETGFLLILPNCDRQEAVHWGQRLIGTVRQWAAGMSLEEPAWGLSVGVATVALPPKNFLPERLVEAARRCLYGSHASGGGVVKSIEIY